MTGRNESPPKLLRSSPDTAKRALHPRAARSAFPSVRGSKRASRSSARGRTIQAQEIDVERASLLQATGQYREALVLRERLAKDDPGIHTLGALASLLAEMDEWAAAETCYAAALDADDGVSPLPCGQLLFEWGVSAMRRGDLDRAEAIFAELDAILPAACSGTGTSRRGGSRARTVGHRLGTHQAAARRSSDDPEYRATYAEILAARGDSEAARAKRSVQQQRMSCCWRDGPKPMPTTPQPSSWALATARSVRSTWPRPIGNSATHHVRAIFWPGRCATRSKFRWMGE